MKSLNVLWLLVLSFLLMTSCAFHSGTLGSNAVIINKDFKVVGIGVGESKYVKVLGIGGLKSNAMVYEAKNDLYEKVGLQKNQALTNITVDTKRENFIVFSRTKVTLTAEIIDFSLANNDNIINNYNVLDDRDFAVGDSVFASIKGGYAMGVIESLNVDDVTLRFNLVELSDTLKSIKYSKVFAVEGSFSYYNKRYKIGDVIKAVYLSEGYSQTVLGAEVPCEAIGVNSSKVLLYYDDEDSYFEQSINDFSK